MNKLFKVVNVELRPSRKGAFVMLCLLDYAPDVEDVDPLKEKIERATEDMPKELAEGLKPVFTALSGLDDLRTSPAHQAHKETGSVLLTMREYEQVGKPTVGQLLKVDLSLTKEAGR